MAMDGSELVNPMISSNAPASEWACRNDELPIFVKSKITVGCIQHAPGGPSAKDNSVGAQTDPRIFYGLLLDHKKLTLCINIVFSPYRNHTMQNSVVVLPAGGF